MNRIIGPLGLILMLCLPALAQPQEMRLTFAEALQHARQSAPAVVAARMRIEEARGRVSGATLPFSSNPTLEVEAGPRTGETSSTDYGIEIGQEIDLPQRRRARIAAAHAAVAQEQHRARAAESEALRQVANAFLRALEAHERKELAAGAKRLAEEALLIAQRRYAAGDVAQLDVNLARTAVTRTDAEERMADASLTGNLTALRILLGTDAPIEVDGSLHDSFALTAPDAIAEAAMRPDILVLDAEIAEAEADQRLAQTLRWPELDVRGSYGREEGDRIVQGGVGITLPLFNRGQESAAIAGARLARLRVEREALRRTIEAEVRGAAATHDALRDAAVAYERTVLPLIEENERLALESYDVGQIGLGDLLLVRREALDARSAFVDQLIETRLAEIELRARAGVWK